MPISRPTVPNHMNPVLTRRWSLIWAGLCCGWARRHTGSVGVQKNSAVSPRRSEFFCTPTALIASLGDGNRQQTYLARVEPGGPDLGKLSELTEVMEALASGELDPVAADARVREIDARPAHHRGMPLLMAYVLVSAGACTLIGGGWREAILAGLLGSITGASVLLLWKRAELSRLLNPLSAGLVTLVGTLWCGMDPQTALMPAVIAGMITLVPGMELTAATRELATGHQVSGE